MAAAKLCGFERDIRSPWRYHLRDRYGELLAIALYVDDCQIVARTEEAATAFLEIRGAMREGQNRFCPRNPPNPAAGGPQERTRKPARSPTSPRNW